MDSSLVIPHRSFVLIYSFSMGITAWIYELKRTPSYAILISGAGTFYGFFHRLWTAVDKNLKPIAQLKHRGTKKGKKRRKSADHSPWKSEATREVDAAHDTESIYHLLNHYDMEPFIDLNLRSKKKRSSTTASDIPISPTGIPMCPNGTDYKLHLGKWRCTPACGRSKAKYGRTFYTKTKDDLSLFTKTPRHSQQWKRIYKRRSSIERSNKQEKMDYKLESGRHRSTMMWCMRLYGIMNFQHVDAWYVSQKDKWDTLKP